MKIVVLDGYTLNPGDNPWDAVAKLGELKVYDRTDPADIVDRARDADIVLTNKTPLSAQTLAQLSKLKFIAVLATGFNIVDTAAARQRNIPVSNVPVYGTDSVAQYVFAMLLEMCHQVAGHNASVHSGEWGKQKDFSYWLSPTIELAGKKMGIVGFGRIGRRVGELANAFGMEVLAFDTFHGNEPSYKPFRWADVAALFREADVVSLHAPQTDSNKEMVNRELLAQMKPTAFLINTARGGLVQERDLAEALNTGRIAGAALDVVSVEPIRGENPLLKAKNCILTPHIAWATVAARRRLMGTVADNIAAFQAGKPANVVN